MITICAYSEDRLVHIHLRVLLKTSIRRRVSATRFIINKGSCVAGEQMFIIMNDDEITNDGDDVVTTNSSASFCRYCGCKILPNSAFCSACGKPLNNTGVPAQPVYASQQPQQANQTTVIVNERKSNGIGTAGFVFALLGIILSWVPVVSFVIWFLGLLFSIIGLFKAPRGFAITGFLLSIIGIIIIIAIFGYIALALNDF